jgi:hypothetical protein
MAVDVDNPFHQASFYIEDMKYGVGPKKVEPVTTVDFRSQLDGLLRDAGISSLSSEDLLAAIGHYSDSWTSTLVFEGMVLPSDVEKLRFIVHSVYSEGVMHGIAFAKELKGSNPYDEKTRREVSE